jgi:hypothetical protein
VFGLNTSAALLVISFPSPVNVCFLSLSPSSFFVLRSLFFSSSYLTFSTLQGQTGACGREQGVRRKDLEHTEEDVTDQSEGDLPAVGTGCQSSVARMSSNGVLHLTGLHGV